MGYYTSKHVVGVFKKIYKFKSKDECIIFLLHLGEICTRVLLRVHKTHCNVYKHFLNAINVHLRQKKSHDDNKLHEKD